MRKTKVAIFASGNGSTAEAFIRSVQEKKYALEVVLLVCNNPGAPVLERVRNLNAAYGLPIQTAVINSRTQPAAQGVVRGQQTSEEQAAILSLLQKHDISLVLLLGYQKRIGPQLIAAYGWLPEYVSPYQCNMLNTHPGLLPDTYGTHELGTQQYVLDHGMRETGHTINAVSAEYDTGPVVAENRVPVLPDDTAETLYARVQATEKQHIAADVMAFVDAQAEYQKNHG